MPCYVLRNAMRMRARNNTFVPERPNSMTQWTVAGAASSANALFVPLPHEWDRLPRVPPLNGDSGGQNCYSRAKPCKLCKSAHVGRSVFKIHPCYSHQL